MSYSNLSRVEYARSAAGGQWHIVASSYDRKNYIGLCGADVAASISAQTLQLPLAGTCARCERLLDRFMPPTP